MLRVTEVLQAASMGDDISNLMLGLMYENGWSVSEDLDKAHRYFEKASRSDSPIALFHFARFLIGRKANAPDPSVPFELYRRAATKDFLPAQNETASCYEFGIGVDPNPKEAFSWRQRAAHAGYVPAQEYLALMYAEGIGTNKDQKQAFRWYLRAAESGVHGAAFHVADRLETGNGSAKDLSRAVEWYRRAAELGSASAHRRLSWAYETGSLGLTISREKQAEHEQKAMVLEMDPLSQFGPEASLPSRPKD